MSVADQIKIVRERMDAAARRAGREPASVRLVAVTKNHPVTAIQEAAAEGVLDIGENKVQEAVGKMELLTATGVRCPGFSPVRPPKESTQPDLRFHLIGHLQTNKARLAVQHFDLIHSVDSERLAAELNRQCEVHGRNVCDILLQANISGEETKGGWNPAEMPGITERFLVKYPRLRVMGWMTMAPYEAEPEATRPVFRGLAEVAQRLCEQFAGHDGFVGTELSMGMTNDFEVAIEEGATLVRIGSAIFGER